MALILVVDDALDARHILSRLLTRAGHAIVVAADGDDALRAIRDHEPDLVLLDLLIPGTDGLGILAALRGHPRPGLAPPVVVVTGVDDEDVRRQAEALGAAAYFIKGEYQPHALLDCIAQLLA